MRVMGMIKQALDEQRVLRIEYRKRGDYLAVKRDIEVYRYDTRYIDAYCRLRQDPRSFRIDRIVRAMLMKETFSIDPAIESIVAVQGWANRTPAWRRERMQSIFLDDLCDELLTEPPQHRLDFFPLPHEHGSSRPTRAAFTISGVGRSRTGPDFSRLISVSVMTAAGSTGALAPGEAIPIMSPSRRRSSRAASSVGRAADS